LQQFQLVSAYDLPQIKAAKKNQKKLKTDGNKYSAINPNVGVSIVSNGQNHTRVGYASAF
jgi:hypothetical protein